MTAKTIEFAGRTVSVRAISWVWRESENTYLSIGPAIFYVIVRADGMNASERYVNKEEADKREAEIIELMEAVQ